LHNMFWMKILKERFAQQTDRGFICHLQHLQPHTAQHVLDEDQEILAPTQTGLVKWLRLSIFAQYVEARAIARALAVPQRILLYKFCSIGYNSQSSSRVKLLLLIDQRYIVIGAGGLWLVGSHLFTPH
jgi:hypothetical protein